MSDNFDFDSHSIRQKKNKKQKALVLPRGHNQSNPNFTTDFTDFQYKHEVVLGYTILATVGVLLTKIRNDRHDVIKLRYPKSEIDNLERYP